MSDFIYIYDVVEITLKLLLEGKSIGKIYNVGTGISRSFQEISDILQHELGTNLGTEYFENPYKGYQLDTKADIQNYIENLGFEPKFSLEEGIKSYVPEIKRLHCNETND